MNDSSLVRMKNAAMFSNIFVILSICILTLPASVITTANAQTALGELEARAAPVFRRICLAGANSGNLCKQDSECPTSTCADRNIFNISVAVHFSANNAQLTSIQNAITSGSAILFDATDGQAEIGVATIHNNAFGTTDADLRVYPASASTGWWANTGSWKTGGSMHISIDRITNGAPGEAFAHEFIHLAFDARDEYEGRAPGCGAINGSNQCPIPATVTAGETACLMDNGGLGTPDGQFSELCWGQGTLVDPTDISAGNHDADNDTEQSICRSNRSCWDQVVWSWPNTILKPAAAPDPAANGKTVNPTKFLVTENTARGVLVLDESGSMGLESPNRISRLQVAADDFVALADDSMELGLVSYATNAAVASGRENISIDTLNNNRATLDTAISNLAPATRTNIGAGLQTAKDMIDAAGGVTGNTFIVLMTDGINNEPSPSANAAADLQSKIDDLLAEGIEVYVTCTGGDTNLQSQCSEIATGTGGFYVDSADASDLAPSFAEIFAFVSGYDMLAEQVVIKGQLRKAVTLNKRLTLVKPSTKVALAKTSKAKLANVNAQPVSTNLLKNKRQSKENQHQFFIEKGSENALFSIQWKQEDSRIDALAISPSGKKFKLNSMAFGRFVKVRQPEPGDWTLQLENESNEISYEVKGYSRNPVMSLSGGVRYPSVLPGKPIYIYAYPKSMGRAVSNYFGDIPVLVRLPNGKQDRMVLHDSGRDKNGKGDDVADDGIFTGVYRSTEQKGAYDFTAKLDMNEWAEPIDAKSHHTKHAHSNNTEKRIEEHSHNAFVSPRFVRTLKLSVAVANPKDIVKEPKHPPAGKKTILKKQIGSVKILKPTQKVIKNDPTVRKVGN